MALSEKRKRTLLDLISQGVGTKEISERVPCSTRTVREYKRIHRHQKIEESGTASDREAILRPETVFLELIKKKKEMKINDLADELNVSPHQVGEFVTYWRTKGHELGVVGDDVVKYMDIPLPVDGVFNGPLEMTEIKFGVASDLHFGSKGCQITALKDFCKICKAEGVKHMFSPGDITAGHRVYKGQEQDLYALTASGQENSCVMHLPEGFEWWMIGGNHDYSWIKNAGGHNVMRAIASKREDVHYLGYDAAIVPILNGVKLKMWHPGGGIPYAVSYKIEKGLERLAYQELQAIVDGIKDQPDIRFVLSGHLHRHFQALFGPIWGAQCGAFEGSNNLTKRMGYASTVGGWIVWASLDPKGNLRRVRGDFYIFPEIINDYLNYDHKIEKEKEIQQPIFATGS